MFVRTLVPTLRKVAVEMKIHLAAMGEELSATGAASWSNCLGMPLSKRLRNLLEACRIAA